MTAASLSFDSAQLSRVIEAVDPSARLVSARTLRRIIRGHLDLSSGEKAPHDLCYELTKSDLLELIDASVLGEALPDKVLLLPLPAEEDLAAPEHVLTDYWRRLFHAAVDRAIERLGNPRFPQSSTLFDATILHEIRTVLESEHRLIDPEDSRELYREFAALFLELHYFAPHLVEVYFPGFVRSQDVVDLLEVQIGAQALFDAARPVGASAPGVVVRERRRIEPATTGAKLARAVPPESTAQIVHFAEKGNDVRAAILAGQLGKITEAEKSLQHLVERLKVPLQLRDDDLQKWYAALRPLLDPASQGFYPVAGRLLYELQKACLDVERKVYAVDLIEWVVSFGKLSIKRLLDKPRNLNVLRRLRAALTYADRAPVSIEQRESIINLLQDAIKEGVHRVWMSNRPILNEVLDQVGLIPESQVERIARNKVVEELLDVLSSRGFLKMSDLRDAIARNRLKLNDLSGPIEFLTGDPLLKANRQLALRMDGVYHRGEIYLRGLQRLTSLAFATSLGRLLVLWLVLPFGGAFVILEGLHHFVEAFAGVADLITGHDATVAAIGMAAGGGAATVIDDPDSGESPMTSDYAIVLVGICLLGLIHAPPFRRQVSKAAQFLFLKLPVAIYESPYVRTLIANPFTRIVSRYLLSPLVAGILTMVAMRLMGFGRQSTLVVGIGMALLMGTLFRTPWGWGLEERMDEVVSRVWRVLSVNFIMGLLTLILRFFQTIFEYIDRGIYAVDEWLRFREGENSLSFAFKLFFGAAWFFVTYVFRFAWNLLIEPQINPIKHFPVVTVSHKLLLPMVPSLAKSFEMSLPTMTTIVSGIPGIFGFLVWECKENWKLYKANSSPVIGPVPVGSHGERVGALLRPGLHSGVVPKQFAKLRRAEAAGRHKKAVKIHHQLDHVAEAVQRLAEREMLAYLEESLRWGGLPIGVHDIRLATNRLRICLTIRQREGSLIVSIEERSGWLIGSIEEPAWLDQLTEPQRVAFADAITSLYKLSGVHVVREQAAAVLGIESHRLDCRPEGLVVLPKGYEREVTIDCNDSGVMEAAGPIDGRKVPPMVAGELILSDCPLEWRTWTERWEADREGKTPTEPILGQYRVLPGASS